MSRNFCDNNGMVTESKHNTLVFENDRRGFIVSVLAGWHNILSDHNTL